MKPLTVFLGGAALGAVIALLLAPESGEETRARLRAFLKNRNILPDKQDSDDFDILMQQISSQIEEE